MELITETVTAEIFQDLFVFFKNRSGEQILIKWHDISKSDRVKLEQIEKACVSLAREIRAICFQASLKKNLN
jgi:hypothetical protein